MTVITPVPGITFLVRVREVGGSSPLPDSTLSSGVFGTPRIAIRGVPCILRYLHCGVHRFRHTFAINFLRNGGNLLALQDLLGHERLDRVRIYAKMAEIDLERQQTSASPADRWKL